LFQRVPDIATIVAGQGDVAAHLAVDLDLL
jgi:hypothetical protein